MARLLLLDITAESIDDMIHAVTCNEIDDYYKYLKCDCFDIATRKIGSSYYDIFVDDNGLFVEHPVVSAIDEKTHEPMLVGNLIFANHDSSGETTSLSADDVKNILENIGVAIFKDGHKQLVVRCKGE